MSPEAFVVDSTRPHSSGVLFGSNPCGKNDKGWNSGRYGAYHSREAWRRHMSDAGFTELGPHYRPVFLREKRPITLDIAQYSAYGEW
jgi:hypothetical protein